MTLVAVYNSKSTARSCDYLAYCLGPAGRLHGSDRQSELRNGHFEISRMLIEARADINKQSRAAQIC